MMNLKIWLKSSFYSLGAWRWLLRDTWNFRVSSRVSRTPFSSNHKVRIPGQHVQNGPHVQNRKVLRCSQKSTIYSQIFTDTQNCQMIKNLLHKILHRMSPISDRRIGLCDQKYTTLDILHGEILIEFFFFQERSFYLSYLIKPLLSCT